LVESSLDLREADSLIASEGVEPSELLVECGPSIENLLLSLTC
jgi:hypothetical protein